MTEKCKYGKIKKGKNKGKCLKNPRNKTNFTQIEESYNPLWSGVKIESKSSIGGIGFFGLLTILFIGLKLTHKIDWSWWWVLSPMIIPIVIVLIIIGALFLFKN